MLWSTMLMVIVMVIVMVLFWTWQTIHIMIQENFRSHTLSCHPVSSLCTVVSHYYDTAGIRKKYHSIQTIEISSINF